MGGLFGALDSSLSALKAFQNALDVAQNNVSNASTPGYANQIATFEAQPFEPNQGFNGGVNSGVTRSTDNHYADSAVMSQYSLQGSFTAQSNALQQIQGLFDVTGQSGVIGALNNLFQSFSAWATNPDTGSNQQAVLSQAQLLAQQFQSAAANLSQITTQLNTQIGGTVQQINNLAAQIAQDNAAIGPGTTPDPNAQANLEASLENLSQLADITVNYNPDGTANVLLGGETALVLGKQVYQIQANFTNASGPNPNAVPDAQILDSNGQDITSQVTQGSLGGQLLVRNTILPSLQGDGTQQGALNILAQQVADRVNAILTSAQTPSGQPGTALFTYNSASPIDVAATLAVNPSILAGQLAPATADGSNAAALQLAGLGSSTDPADQINGQTILQFAAASATAVGQQTSDAQNGANLHSQLLAQAQGVQNQISGVSLDANAVQVLELQKGYDAAGKMVSVIDSLTTSLIDMVK